MRSRLSRLSRPQDLLRRVPRQRVEEEEKEESQARDNQHFDQQPLVVVPQDESKALNRIHEPEERGVRATKEKYLNCIFLIYI